MVLRRPLKIWEVEEVKDSSIILDLTLQERSFGATIF